MDTFSSLHKAVAPGEQASLLAKTDRASCQIDMRMQKITKIILKNKNKMRILALPNFKTYYKNYSNQDMVLSV